MDGTNVTDHTTPVPEPPADEYGAHKPDADLLKLHPCPCEKDCPCDLLEAWVSVDKRLTPALEGSQS
jgi:hypothetical protein